MKRTGNKEYLFHSKMSLDWKAKLITYFFVVAIGVGVPLALGLSYALIFDNTLYLLFPVPFVVIFYVVWLYSPIGVTLTKSDLFIERRAGSIKITRSSIKSAQPIENLHKQTGFVLRTWGAGGVWGWFGFFWSKSWGHFKAHVTRDDSIVLIELSDDKKILVSPDNRKGFLSALKNN